MKAFQKPNVKETVRTSQREIKGGVRDLDREVLALKREEAKLIADIKVAAKRNDQASMRVLAKSLVRLRGQISKMQASSAQLRGVSTQITTAAATSTVATSVAAATKAMSSMQTAIDPAKMQKTILEFAKENGKMEMAGEMMGDAMDDAMDGEDMEDETGELVGQILDEIGVDTAAALRSAPQRRVGQAQASSSAVAEDGDMEALSTRLAGLKS